MDFQDFAKVNLERCKRWHPNGGLYSWSMSDWAMSMAGEAGEACNAVKKMRRFQDALADNKLVDDPEVSRQIILRKIAGEIADTVIYADILAQFFGFDLQEIIREKFNQTSAEYGFPERL